MKESSVDILIITQNFPPDISAGAFRMDGLYRSLAQKTSSVKVLTAVPSRVRLGEAINNQDPNITYISQPFSSWPLGSYLNYLYFFIVAFLTAFKLKPRLVFSTSSKLGGVILGHLCAVATKSKLALDIRDLFLLNLSELKSGFGFLIRLLRYLERRSFERADQIFVVSKGFNEYEGLKNFHQKIVFIPNGCDGVMSGKLGGEAKFSKSGCRILYVGTLGLGQGLSAMLENFVSNLPDDYFVQIVGAGSDSEKIGALADRFPERLSLHGPIKRESLAEFYERSDILFLNLNDIEAFKLVLPSKIFELVEVNKPILAGVSGYARQFIESETDEGVYYFPPSDGVQAAKIAKEITLKSHDYSRIKQNYNRSKLSNALANYLISLIR